MELNVSNTAFIVAASQSLLLAILIFQKHRVLLANRFLTALMLCYTAILVHLLFQDSGVYRTVPIAFVLVGATFAASPLHFLYTKYLLNQTTPAYSKTWLHFLPFGIFESIILVSIIFNITDFLSASTSAPSSTPFSFRVINFVLIAQGMLYMVSSSRLIMRYNKYIKDVSSSLEQIRMNWLRNITLAAIAAWLLFFIEDMLLMQGINLSNFILASIMFAAYVYAIGFVGLMKSEIFSSPEIEKTIHQISAIALTKETEEQSSRYEKSGLAPEAAQHIVEQVLVLMKEKKPYIHFSLTLSQLAEMLSVSPHNLSEVINTKLQKNFYDFINGYRVEQIKNDLADPAKQHLKILSLAFDAGFNSKATFNTVFKQHTGTTPSAFRTNALAHKAT